MNCLFKGTIIRKMSIYKGTVSVLSGTSKVVDTDIKLNCGTLMPIIGFGTYTIKGRELIFKVIDAALRAGYRSIDTAGVYGNEEDIGLALKKFLPVHNLKREDIFITSKLAPKDQGKDKVKAAISSSLNNLQTSYLDLYLIHWPGASGLQPGDVLNAKLRKESWEGLVEAHKAGILRAIGVSNYTTKHLKELLEYSNIPPAVNQVEFHPHYKYSDRFLDVCNNAGVLLQAYSSLGGNSVISVLDDPLVKKAATKLKVTRAQILLRWGLQNGFSIIPKSVTTERIVENSKLDFEIPEEIMKTLNGITRREKYAWNPDVVD